MRSARLRGGFVELRVHESVNMRCPHLVERTGDEAAGKRSRFDGSERTTSGATYTPSSSTELPAGAT